MITKELKSLIKLSERIGKFDYYDGLMYYMLAHKEDPFGLPDSSLKYIPKVNKLLTKDVGKIIFKEDAMPLSIGVKNEDPSLRLREYSMNFMLQEPMRAASYTPLTYGYKLGYKTILSASLCLMSGARIFMSLMESGIYVGNLEDTAKELLCRDEDIFRMIMSQLPDEFYLINNRDYDLTPTEKYKKESDLNYEYSYDYNEAEYLSDRFRSSKKSSDEDYLKLRLVVRKIIIKWLFSGCKTIKEFVNS